MTSVIEVALGDENGELITTFVEFERFDCDSLVSCGFFGTLVDIPDAGGQTFHDVRFRWSTSTEAIDPIPVDVRITAVRIRSNEGRVGAWEVSEPSVVALLSLAGIWRCGRARRRVRP